MLEAGQNCDELLDDLTKEAEEVAEICQDYSDLLSVPRRARLYVDLLFYRYYEMISRCIH